MPTPTCTRSEDNNQKSHVGQQAGFKMRAMRVQLIPWRVPLEPPRRRPNLLSMDSRTANSVMTGPLLKPLVQPHRLTLGDPYMLTTIGTGIRADEILHPGKNAVASCRIGQVGTANAAAHFCAGTMDSFRAHWACSSLFNRVHVEL
jgi:hypothetical protein